MFPVSVSGDVEVAVRTERDAVRELDATVEQLDRGRFAVDAIHASIVREGTPIGIELHRPAQALEHDAGVSEVKIAVRRKREIVQEQEPARRRTPVA